MHRKYKNKQQEEFKGVLFAYDEFIRLSSLMKLLSEKRSGLQLQTQTIRINRERETEKNYLDMREISKYIDIYKIIRKRE